MPRINPLARKKKKHVARPMLTSDGKTLILRDKNRLSHFTDYVKPKVKDLQTDDEIAFIEPGEFVKRGIVVSTTATEVYLRVAERAKVGGKWTDIYHDYKITAAAILGHWHEFERRVHVIDRLVAGRTYGLGYRLDGVGAPVGDLYGEGSDNPNVSLV